MIAGQGDLFTDHLVPSGDALATEAIARVESNADQDWLSAARRIVQQLAGVGEPFTTDIVWARLDQLGLVTHEPRAMGAVMRAAARSGLIRAQGYVKTTRPEAHSRPIPVYVGTGKKAEAA